MAAKLRVCASCEWVFNKGIECPKCSFGSYSAWSVYGNASYPYAKSQIPYRKKKTANFLAKLAAEVEQERLRTKVQKLSIL